MPDAIQEAEKRRKTESWDFPGWLVENLRVKRGGVVTPYNFKGFEPYREIAANLHRWRELWVLKGTQIGFSTMMLGWALYLVHWRGLDVGYALPDKTLTKPFMRTRFLSEQVNSNPALSKVYTANYADMLLTTGAHFLYLLGANVLSDQISRPMDAILLDEVTIVKPDAIEKMRERLHQSDFGQKMGFAREIYPGGPADSGYKAGTQTRFLVTCSNCGFEHCIEDEIFKDSENKLPSPRAFQVRSGDWQHVCVRCEAPYQPHLAGRWVDTFPEREVKSYRVPQVIFSGRLSSVMEEWRRSISSRSHRANFHASALAIPDAGDLQALSRADFSRVVRQYSMERRQDWTVAGIDVGNTYHAIFAKYAEGENALQVVWTEEIHSDQFREKIAEIIDTLGVAALVIDGMPLTDTARWLAYQYPDIVHLNWYRQGVRDELAEVEAFGPDAQNFKKVSQDRETALESYVEAIKAKTPSVIFPREVVQDGRVVDFYNSRLYEHHLVGSQREEVESARLGKKVLRYRRAVENHFFHAGVYMLTALRAYITNQSSFVGAIPAAREIR